MPVGDPVPYNPYGQIQWTQSRPGVVTCATYRTTMRLVARHGSTKTHWHCDDCSEARRLEREANNA